VSSTGSSTPPRLWDKALTTLEVQTETLCVNDERKARPAKPATFSTRARFCPTIDSWAEATPLFAAALAVTLQEIAEVHESQSGPKRRLLQESNMSGVEGKADVTSSPAK
jgi:hypothetical protein